MAARLTLNDVSLRFGGIKVLEEVSFDVEPGAIFGLVGPNGAGKTSLFNCISGHYQPEPRARSRIDGDRGRRARARRRSPGTAWRGRSSIRPSSCTRPCSRTCCSARTPGCPAGRWSGRCGCRAPAGPSEALRAEARDLLERNGLGWAADLHADELSHGLHKGVELCRALLVAARGCCCSTSPPPGLPHSEVEQLIATVRRLRTDDDITVVIVEHHMGLIAALTDRVVVLDHGRKLMEGTAAEAQSDPRVIEAYIGKDAADDAA